MTTHYTRTAIVLHWLIGVTIIGLLAVGFYMTSLKLSPGVIKLYMMHKSIGVTLLGLVLLRIVWRLTHQPPALPPNMPTWQVFASKASHLLLYALMLAMPISGVLMNSATGTPMKWFGLVKLPSLMTRNAEAAAFWKQTHEFLAFALLAMIGLHILAALKHQLFDRDGIMGRMWWSNRRE